MGWHSRSRFPLDAFRSLSSKIVPKNPIRNSNPKVCQSSSSTPPSSSKYKVSGFPLSSPISRNLGFQFGVKQNQCNLLPGGARRYYYVDRHQVQHFRARGPGKWFQNPTAVLIAGLVGSGVFITVYVGNLETVPYTKRKHLVLLSRNLERQLGELEFQAVKKEYKGKILPAIHPDSVRVRLISKNIIEALQRGLSPEKVWSDSGFVSESADGMTETGGQETLVAVALSESNEEKWAREDEILDDKWVQESRKKGQQRGSQSAIAHLEGINWEVLVVSEPHVNAFCLPGGKIVVFTGLLNHFKTDAEIATVIGHEVGHVLARHSAESVTQNLWFAILLLILSQFTMPDIAHTMSNFFLKLPFSRRMEIEADYIGLLLLASAGYDPRTAPKVYEKMGQIGRHSALNDYLTTHPSGMKRARLLAQAKVMEEAMAIYQDVQMGRGGVEGFL